MTQQELEKAIQEVWALFRETSERFKETDRRFKETDKRIERLSQETDKKIGRMSLKVEEVSKTVAALTGKWGRFVEGLIAPGTISMFKERGIGVEKVYQRVKAHKDGREIEIDILAINKEYAILIEAKSSLGISDVDEHIERLKAFKVFFPEYSDRKVVGAVAGITIEEEADRYAYRHGLFVIGQSGETVKILNDKKFRPKVW